MAGWPGPMVASGSSPFAGQTVLHVLARLHGQLPSHPAFRALADWEGLPLLLDVTDASPLLCYLLRSPRGNHLHCFSHGAARRSEACPG